MHTQRKTGLNRGVAGTKVEGPWYEDQRLWNRADVIECYAIVETQLGNLFGQTAY